TAQLAQRADALRTEQRRQALIDRLKGYNVKFDPKAPLAQLERLEQTTKDRSDLRSRLPEEQAKKLHGASLAEVHKVYSDYLLEDQRAEALARLKELGVKGVDKKPLP